MVSRLLEVDSYRRLLTARGDRLPGWGGGIRTSGYCQDSQPGGGGLELAPLELKARSIDVLALPVPPVRPTERIAHLGTAEDCCAAAFRAGRCRRWGHKRICTKRHARFIPADIGRQFVRCRIAKGCYRPAVTRRDKLREALINAKMRSFAVQANVFLVKAGSSQRRVGAGGLVRRTQMSCGRDTGLRAPTARTPGPRSWRCRDNAPCDSRTGT
jgi:hypothetical protein